MPKDLPSAAKPRARAQSWLDRYRAVRRQSEALAAPFSAEDLCVQTMPDVSPGKWHLAHVTWFWETFLLTESVRGYRPFDPRFNYLFNSYYDAIGDRHARPERGLLTRPPLSQVMDYRKHVDDAVAGWFEQASVTERERMHTVLLTGLAHEEQHQELFLTDIKHVLSCNSFPEIAYRQPARSCPALGPRAPSPSWTTFEGGLYSVGHRGDGFAFDNEGPRHKAWLEPFALANRPVTNAEFLAFIEDGGYQTASLWLSEGWARIQAESRTAPFYWRRDETGWREFSLHGGIALDPDAPVSHLDYFEASAFAAWAGARLPEEREWEIAAAGQAPGAGRWADPAGWLHPQPPARGDGLEGLYGEVWEWTRSAYAAYPGFAAPQGPIGEYNGKFMCNQFVLRGGSALTPPNHVRASYRNFFPADARWQMTGLRLARDL